MEMKFKEDVLNLLQHLLKESLSDLPEDKHEKLKLKFESYQKVQTELIEILELVLQITKSNAPQSNRANKDIIFFFDILLKEHINIKTKLKNKYKH